MCETWIYKRFILRVLGPTLENFLFLGTALDYMLIPFVNEVSTFALDITVCLDHLQGGFPAFPLPSLFSSYKNCMMTHIEMNWFTCTYTAFQILSSFVGSQTIFFFLRFFYSLLLRVVNRTRMIMYWYIFYKICYCTICTHSITIYPVLHINLFWICLFCNYYDIGILYFGRCK